MADNMSLAEALHGTVVTQYELACVNEEIVEKRTDEFCKFLLRKLVDDLNDAPLTAKFERMIRQTFIKKWFKGCYFIPTTTDLLIHMRDNRPEFKVEGYKTEWYKGKDNSWFSVIITKR